MGKRQPTTSEYQDAAELRQALRRFLRRTEDVVRAHRLTPQRYQLLLVIKASGGRATVASVTRSLHMGQTSVTQLVRRAEKLGLLRREPSVNDRRVGYLHLTSEGERRLAAAVADLRGDRDALVSTLKDINDLDIT